MITGERISLHRLTEEDVTQEYVDWMNDIEVVRYTESRFYQHTRESTLSFVRSVTNEFNYAFAIVDNDTKQHLGNIKIGNINPYHKNADVGLIIGRKEFWGKGIATEAIRLCVGFAFRELKLHRLWAGVYASNIGSAKAFERAGFSLESTRREAVLLDGEWQDCFIYGLVNHEQ